MKSIKSFSFLLIMIIFYTYIIFFFKIFRLDSIFTYFHWALLLIMYMGIAIISFLPIHFKLPTITTNLLFFTSLSYIGFILSAILCAAQAFRHPVTSLHREALYSVNLTILLGLIVLSCIAAVVTTHYPQWFKCILSFFGLIVVVQHFVLLYYNAYFNMSLLSDFFASFRSVLIAFAITAYGLALLGTLFYTYRMKLKHSSATVTYIVPLCVCLLISFKLFIEVLYGYHSLILSFLIVLISVSLVYILSKCAMIILSEYIACKLSLHQQSSQIMNKYYEQLSQDKATLTTKFQYTDSMYQQMLAFYPDAFFIILNFNICDTNEFGMKLLGLSEKSSLLDKNFLDLVSPVHHSKLRALIKNLTLGDKTPVNCDFELIKQSGERIYVEGSFILTNIYNYPSILVSLRDLSFHKETYELQRQIEMEKLKVEFFSTISHELRTPVNIIYSASQLQETLIKKNKIGELGTYTQMINHNCLRLLRLLNNILDISRLDSNYFSVKAEVFNIVPASELILESIIPYANKKGITPIFDTDSEEIYCHLDPELYERILLNLLSNAVKYGKENGQITMTLSACDHHASISIKDDGIGIPKEKTSYIFNRFTRVENGLIRNAEGSGIGLSLVKSLVEKHEGKISVLSEVDCGTEFTIQFPLASPIDDTLSNYPLYVDTAKIELEFSDVFYSKS